MKMTLIIVLACLSTACGALYVSGAGSGSSTSTTSSSDPGITSAVRSKLNVDPLVGDLNLAVVTRGGVVTLSGEAAEQSQRTRAETLTRSVKGVQTVNNRIIVTE